MTGKRRIWLLKNADKSKSRQLAAALGVLPVTASILLHRGITTPEEARKFLTASLADLENPYELPDMQAGAQRIKQAILHNENILIYGDYDVDGITGTVLLTDLLRCLGGKVNYYIPNRMAEGYGLNKEALIYAKETGTDLIVTVDCGISSWAEAAFSTEMGMDLVITDHHQLPEQLPRALAVINPKLAEESKPWYDLSGVGVAFKVGQAVASLFSQEQLGEEYLDLVALGTIADIVPLRGENRILVKDGLERIKLNKSRPGLQGLLEQTGLKGKEITSGHVGFVLAPRLNACGRLGKADLAVRLFLSRDPHEIEEICRALEEENKTRRKVEEKIYQEALERLTPEDETGENKLIFLSASNWHPGVIGIVASRLTEKYYRPTILLNLEEGTGQGSARSIPGFDLYKALEQVKEELCKFGGHEIAAGLTLSEEKIPVVQKYLQEYACAVLDEKSLTPELHIDAEVTLEEINERLVEETQLLGPFGQGNPSPLFVLRNGCLAEVRKVGQEGKHLQLKVSDKNKHEKNKYYY
jgi:single-stranded-DNA-specific exonuclease